MKRLLAIWLLTMCCAGQVYGGTRLDLNKSLTDNFPDVTDPAERALLDKKTPAAWHCKAFDEALALIHERTGLKVVCAERLKEVYRGYERQIAGPERFKSGCLMGYSLDSTEDDEKDADGKARAVSIGEFLWRFCPRLNLSCAIDMAKGTLTLEPEWKADDTCTAKEEMESMQRSAGSSHEGYAAMKQWRKTFDALLSKEQNFDRAVRVRQREAWGSRMEAESLLTICDIVNTKLQRYTLVVLCHDPIILPGCRRMSYYWFKRDGTFVGANLTWLEYGAVSALAADTLEQSDPGSEEAEKAEKPDKPSDLQFIYRTGANFKDHPDGRGWSYTNHYMVGHFVLDEKGLKLTRLTDIDGKKVKPSLDFNASSLPEKPEKK